MPGDGSATCAGCGSACSETASFQNVAWKVASQLGWSDTLDAEYVALTQLQADDLVGPRPIMPRTAPRAGDYAGPVLDLSSLDLGDIASAPIPPAGQACHA